MMCRLSVVVCLPDVVDCNGCIVAKLLVVAEIFTLTISTVF